jgi:hypothetical protein
VLNKALLKHSAAAPVVTDGAGAGAVPGAGAGAGVASSLPPPQEANKPAAATAVKRLDKRARRE